jgi:ribosomal protein L37E
MRFGAGTLGVFISDRRRVWIFCARCGRAHLKNTFKLADKYGRDISLELVRQTLTCPDCQDEGTSYFVPEAYRRLVVPNSRRGGYSNKPPTLRIKDIDVSHGGLVLSCRHPGCQRSVEYHGEDLERFKAIYPPEAILYDVLGRMRCRACGNREIAASVDNYHVPGYPRPWLVPKRE